MLILCGVHISRTANAIKTWHKQQKYFVNIFLEDLLRHENIRKSMNELRTETEILRHEHPQLASLLGRTSGELELRPTC